MRMTRSQSKLLAESNAKRMEDEGAPPPVPTQEPTSSTSYAVTVPSPIAPPDLAALFECAVCLEMVLPPIVQCQSGHLVCYTCRVRVNYCPTCRELLTDIRNFAMEKVANTVMFRCKYMNGGCQTSVAYNEKSKHEEECDYRPYSCPCPGSNCRWEGVLEQVMPHLISSHKTITTLQGEDIVFLVTDINLVGAVDWVMMQCCFGHYFLLILEKKERVPGHSQFYAIVQIVASKKQAEGFVYKLELSGNRRRLTYEASPRSIHEGMKYAIANSDCLIFGSSTVKLFEDNGNLGINVSISMVKENAENDREAE